METRVKAPLAANRRRALLFVLTLVLPALILLLRPLGFTLQQSVILSALVLTILWWVTGVVERTAASLFLLAAFLLCSGAPVQTVFSFPLSENFVLITVSFLFSQGISNSGLPGKLLQPLLAHFARSPGRMVLSLLLSAAAMMFLIPQPFSRIIILSLIYREYFARINLSEPLRTALLFGLYYFSILINMSMIRGDIILNGALSSMAGLTVDEGVWAAYMLAPTLAYLLAAVLLYRFLFRRVLRTFPSSPAQTAERVQLTGSERRNLVFLLAVVVLWATEDFHPLTGTLVGGSRHGAHVPPGAAAPAGRKGHQRQAADFPHSGLCHRWNLKVLRCGRPAVFPFCSCFSTDILAGLRSGGSADRGTAPHRAGQQHHHHVGGSTRADVHRCRGGPSSSADVSHLHCGVQPISSALPPCNSAAG